MSNNIDSSDLRLVVLTWILTAVPMAAADDWPQWHWPQWRGPTRDGVWRKTGIVEQFDQPQLPVRWRVPVASGYR